MRVRPASFNMWVRPASSFHKSTYCPISPVEDVPLHLTSKGDPASSHLLRTPCIISWGCPVSSHLLRLTASSHLLRNPCIISSAEDTLHLLVCWGLPPSSRLLRTPSIFSSAQEPSIFSSAEDSLHHLICWGLPASSHEDALHRSSDKEALHHFICCGPLAPCFSSAEDVLKLDEGALAHLICWGQRHPASSHLLLSNEDVLPNFVWWGRPASFLLIRMSCLI